MDEVRCYRCGRRMRWIPRLKILFCDNDGYILTMKDAIVNGLIETKRTVNTPTH